jgi:hypothetical protein
MKPIRARRACAITLAELLIASVVGGLSILILFSGAMSMQRCFIASQDLSSAKREQTRLSDYLAMDLRRSFTLKKGTDGETIVTLTMPDYYDSDGNPRTPTITKYVHSYGDANKPMTVVYTKKGSLVYRKENSSDPVQIAEDVADFQLNIDDGGQVVQTQISFQPKFKRNVPTNDEASQKATTLYSTIVLRNQRKDIK